MVFESKKLEHAQCNYSTYENELFFIVPALKKWKQYFLIVKWSWNLQIALYSTKIEREKSSLTWNASRVWLSSSLPKREVEWCGRWIESYAYGNAFYLTKFKNKFIESMRGLCEHDPSYWYAWMTMCGRAWHSSQPYLTSTFKQAIYFQSN